MRSPSLFIKGMQWGVITVYCTQGGETLVETGADWEVIKCADDDGNRLEKLHGRKKGRGDCQLRWEFVFPGTVIRSRVRSFVLVFLRCLFLVW